MAIEGLHGEMDYMQRHGTRRSRPQELHPGTIRVISVRMDYLPETAADIESFAQGPSKGVVSRYALGTRLPQNDAQTPAKTGPTDRATCRPIWLPGICGFCTRCWKKRWLKKPAGLDRQTFQPDQQEGRQLVFPG